MARLIFPDESERLVYRQGTAALAPVPAGTVVSVYTDAGASVPADVQHLDGSAVTSGAPLAINAYSQLPRFLGPADGTDTLYVVVSGGPASAVHADSDARLDALGTRVTALEPGGGGAALARSANLGDLANAGTARTNLGLGTAATTNTGTGSTNSILGSDARLSDARTPTAHASTHASAGSDAVTPAAIGATKTATTTATKTSNYTASPWELVIADATGGTFTITLPAASTAGQTVSVKNISAVAVTVQRAGSDTINAAATSTSVQLQDQVVMFTSDGAGKWWISGGQKSVGSLDTRYMQSSQLGWGLAAGPMLAVPAATLIPDAAVTASSTSVSSPGGHFASSMEGQYFLIDGAGSDLNAAGATPWGNGPLMGTFHYVSATSGTLSVAASATLTGISMSIGPDALSALNSALGLYRTVFLPDNTDYFVSGEVVVPSNTTLRGSSRKTRIISPVQNANTIVSGLTTNPVVRDLTIVGNGYGTQPANTTPTSGNPNWTGAGTGIVFAGVNKGLVENVALINCGGTGTAPRNGVAGIWLTYGCIQTTVRGCYAFQCRNGYNEDDFFNSTTDPAPLDNVLVNNVAEYCEFGIAQDSGSLTRGLLIDGNAIRYCIHSGIDCHRSRYVRVVNNVCYFNGAGLTNAGIVVYGDSVSVTYQRAVVANNVCFGNGTHGIKVSTDVSDYVVQGNICTSNFRHGIYLNLSANGGILQGNVVANNGLATDAPGTYDGIRITSCTNVHILGNRSFNSSGTSQNYGLRADGSSDNLRLVSNDFAGNAVGPLSVVGSSTQLAPPSRGSLQTAGLGFKGETFPRAVAGGTAVPAAGDLRVTLVGLLAGDVVGTIYCHQTAAGSGVTLFKYVLLDSAGVKLAASTDQSSGANSGTGVKSGAMATAYTVPVDGSYYLGIVTVGGTSPTLLRGSSGITGYDGSSPAGPKSSAVQTGQTDVPASSATLSGSSTAWWFAWA